MSAHGVASVVAQASRAVLLVQAHQGPIGRCLEEMNADLNPLEQYPGLPYYLLGGLFLGLSSSHLLATNETLATTGFRGLLPVLLAGGLLAAGYLFRPLAPSRRLVVHAGLLLGMGAGFAAAIAGYIVWIEAPNGLTVAAISYPLIVAGAAGALLATPITYYYVEATQRLAELTEQREQLRVYRRAMDEAAIGIVITDPTQPDNPITYVNDWFEELTGYEAADIRGRNCRFLQGPETDAQPVGRMREAIAAAEPVTVELVNYRKDGTPFWNRVTITPVPGEDGPDGTDGDVTCFLGFQEDVTDRVERERELERYETVVETVNEAVWVLDEAKRLVFLNQRGGEMLGGESDAVVGQPLSSFAELLGDAFDDYERLVDELLAGERNQGNMDLDIRLPDGQVTVNVTLVPLESDGERAGIVGVGRDITERVERERELERYETIVEAAPDPIYAVDRGGHFTLVNDAFLQVFDRSREDLYETDATNVLDSETVEGFDGLVKDLLKSDERQRTVEVPIALDGERRLFEISVALLTREDDFRGSVGVARDITALRERERRLTVLDRVLRHNLRNKMNIVLGHAEAIAAETADAGLGEHARAIEHAGEQLLELGEQARRFEESIDPSREADTPWDLVELVEQVVDAARTDHPEADIAIDLPGEAWARASGTLELALAELIENAVKHNDRDQPTVRVSVTTETDEVAIRVADDGPGFGDMERWTLLRGTESPLEHLQGLGLWLVRWAATGAGGNLDIEANDPRGSVVTMRLPRVPPEQVADSNEDDIPTSGRGA